MSYAYTRKVNCSFENTLVRVAESLKQEGFGILTEIDVQDTLKNKIDVEMDRYVILGACNPHFAYRALQLECAVGLLLPCNVIVYECDAHVYVASIEPAVAIGKISAQEGIQNLAQEVQNSLHKALNRIS